MVLHSRDTNVLDITVEALVMTRIHGDNSDDAMPVATMSPNSSRISQIPLYIDNAECDMKGWSARVCLTNTSVDEQSTPKSRSLHKKSQNLQRATTLPHYWASRNVDLAGSILSLRAAGRVPQGSHGSGGARHSGSSCPLGGYVMAR